MELSKTVDNLRFMANELKREHGENPKHEALVRIRTLENAIKELDGKRWIPVTERLPEVGIYLVTCDDEKYPVKVMRFKESEDTLLWYTSRGIYDGRIYAWMPLPEPYKKRGE